LRSYSHNSNSRHSPFVDSHYNPMKRKIIQINEDKCNGCGLCITICAEAALELVDGKAKLVKDFYCDGMGACLDVCPVDALKIVEIEAEEYDPEKTFEHVKKTRGEEEAKNIHGLKEKKSAQDPPAMECGCPGTMMRDFRSNDTKTKEVQNAPQQASELRQWPIQLHLLSPAAPYLENADLLIAADCAPFAYANFHPRFLKDKALIMFCPKLDQGQDIYIEKLTEIFKHQNIKSITILHMEVPCCGGIEQIVREAMNKSAQNITIKDYTISVQGEII